jgi:hypothetical protein
MRRIRSGIGALDELLTGGGIITLSSNSRGWLSHLITNIIVRSHDPKLETLYLHWVDYHKRYWTIDLDAIMDLAKRVGADFNSLSQNLFFMRAFSRDNIENEENWKTILEFSDKLNLVLLDTLSDLYLPEKKRHPFRKTFAFALGRLARICMKNDCPGIVLSASSTQIHPFLGEISSTIIEFNVGRQILLNLIKHPCLREQSFFLQIGNQRTLEGWM